MKQSELAVCLCTCASPELEANPEVVLAAVKQNGLALNRS